MPTHRHEAELNGDDKPRGGSVVEPPLPPRSWGTTAEAENQVDIDKTSAIASSASARHLPAVSCSHGSVIAVALGTARIRARWWLAVANHQPPALVEVRVLPCENGGYA